MSLLAVICLFAGMAGVASADSLDVDDELTVSDTMSFGTVCPGDGPLTRSAIAKVNRAGGGVNVYANSTLVTITAGAPSDPQLTAANTSLTTPATWVTTGTTISATANVILNVSNSATPGAKNATILYTASGNRNAPNPGNPNPLTTTDPLAVTWTVHTDVNFQLTNIVAPSAVTLGDTTTFTLTIANSGPCNAADVTVGALLPVGLEFVSAGPASGTTYDATTGAWTIGTLANNSAPLTLTLTARAITVGDHTLSATASTASNNLGDTIGDATVTVTAPPVPPASTGTTGTTGTTGATATTSPPTPVVATPTFAG